MSHFAMNYIQFFLASSKITVGPNIATSSGSATVCLQVITQHFSLCSLSLASSLPKKLNAAGNSTNIDNSQNVGNSKKNVNHFTRTSMMINECSAGSCMKRPRRGLK